MIKLHRILYCSRSRLLGGPQEVAATIRSILAASRKNNRRQDVSGALLFSDGCFAQVLEGPLPAVEAIFERIQCDARHSEVTVFQSGAVQARDFADWSMAFAGDEAACDPIAGIPLSNTLSEQTAKGQELVALMKGIVVRETQWLALS